MSEKTEFSVGSGAGSSLPGVVLALAGICTVVAVLVSAMSIHLQLKNYRKPILQRMVVRIMVMVPLYGISSFIALYSLEAAFVIDVIRDIYEAFVIYCFFSLLLSYLGGERSLLILLHGRPPKHPVFPVSLFQSEIDASDPHTFLFLKRGILQYVQVKPVLAVVTLILKATGKYREGDFSATSGYLYVTIVYNISICLSLYCLGMFWMCINNDLSSFRPIPKFICVKGILFFSFWQSFAISILVAAGVITKLGPYTDSEHISLGLTDTLICIEMPFFAIAHMYAFAHTDYIDPKLSFVARMPMYYAFRDAFGSKDVVEDSKATLRGKGMDYREFEPAEGYMHQGLGRERRIRAGLRYSKGGKRKYWLPKLSQETDAARRGDQWGVVRGLEDDVHSPFLPGNEVDPTEEEEEEIYGDSIVDGGFELPFGDLEAADEELFGHSRKYLFGDYNYPCIDVSSENARVTMWDEEERVLRDERGAWFSPIRGAKGRIALDRRDSPAWEGYGAIRSHPPRNADEGKGKRRSTYSNAEVNRRDGRYGEYTVDFDQDRTPPVEATDVRLKWTKVALQGSHSSSQVRGRDTDPASPGSAASSPVGSSRSLQNRVNKPTPPPPPPPPQAPPQPSRSRTHSRPRSMQVLPPDAVDLVVEDGRAAEEERTRERRKGEPAARGTALKKMYRREFVPPAVVDAVEGVEREREERVTTGGGEDFFDVVGGVKEEAPSGPPTGHESPEPDRNTATAPVHTRSFLGTVDGRGVSEENPWA